MDFGGIHSCPETGLDQRAVDNVRYRIEKRDEELVGPRLREAAFGSQSGRRRQQHQWSWCPRSWSEGRETKKRKTLTWRTEANWDDWDGDAEVRLVELKTDLILLESGKVFSRWGAEQPPPVQDGDRDCGQPGSSLLEKGADRPGSDLLEKGDYRLGVYRQGQKGCCAQCEKVVALSLCLLASCGRASLSHPRVRRGPGLRASRQHPSQEGG